VDLLRVGLHVEIAKPGTDAVLVEPVH
jgi:hypothetical protein